MNVLYLIGNGFDLNVGLNTNFSSILKSYLCEKTDDTLICSFKEDIKNSGIKNWANFEEKMGQYTDEIKKKDDPILTFLDYENCIMDFKKFMVEYLKKEEKKVLYKDLNPYKNIAYWKI